MAPPDRVARYWDSAALAGIGMLLAGCSIGGGDGASELLPANAAPAASISPPTAASASSPTPPAASASNPPAKQVQATATPLANSAAAGTDTGSGAPTIDLRCQADATLPQKVDYAQPGPFEVATIEIAFEDTSRPIEATDKHAAAPSRSLPTTIYYPTPGAVLFEQAPVADGPLPMLMYSHGYSSSRDEATPVATQAASYGYIVVVPEFPLTNIFAPDGPDIMDAVNQPGDVSYLIDQMLAFSKDPNDLFANKVDETRIGAVGLSLGGLTTLLVSYHPKLHDERIKAVLPIAGLSSFFAEGFYHTRELPMLILHGDLDAFINYEFNGRRTFTRAAPNARLVTVAKGTHAAWGAQLDPTTTALVNALIAPEGTDPSNPDGLGCGAVGPELQMTGPEFVETLGGPDEFIERDPNPAASVPCSGDEYTQPAIDATEQEKLAIASVPAFFDAHFAKTLETRQDGCHYLLYELTKNPAVKLE